MGIGAPSKMLRAVQDFFDAHLEDHIGVGADPGSARRYLTQHRIEYCSGLPLMDWIDPYEHPINRQKLLAHLVGDVVGINRRLGVNSKSGELFEHAVIASVLRGRGSPRLAIAAPEDCDSTMFRTDHVGLPKESRAPKSRLPGSHHVCRHRSLRHPRLALDASA